MRHVATATLTTVLLKHGMRNVRPRGTRPLAPDSRDGTNAPSRCDSCPPGLLFATGLTFRRSPRLSRCRDRWLLDRSLRFQLEEHHALHPHAPATPGSGSSA